MEHYFVIVKMKLILYHKICYHKIKLRLGSWRAWAAFYARIYPNSRTISLCWSWLFLYFFTSVHKVLIDKLHLDFSSEYYIDQQNSDATHQDGRHVIPYGKVDMDSDEPHHQCPENANPTYQLRDSNPNPTKQVTWSDKLIQKLIAEVHPHLNQVTFRSACTWHIVAEWDIVCQ